MSGFKVDRRIFFWSLSQSRHFFCLRSDETTESSVENKMTLSRSYFFCKYCWVDVTFSNLAASMFLSNLTPVNVIGVSDLVFTTELLLRCRKLFPKKVVVTNKIVGSKRQLSPACLRHFSNWLRWQTWRQTLTSHMPVASHWTFFKNISLTNLAVKDNMWLLLMLKGKSIKSNWQTW